MVERNGHGRSILVSGLALRFLVITVTTTTLLPANSDILFRMGEDQPCTVACRLKLSAEDANNFKEKIRDDFRVNMFLGNLTVKQGQAEGFRVGFKGTYDYDGKPRIWKIWHGPDMIY
ncbi:Nonaspanin (TM9SF) [Corchorus olitorius]|uniref:Nonaspanin (TM9SF) n=1 Tax=Corchorus olitorius TaxID=93759 RepID=A0A1R3J9Z8_9ROSI|nr:Nonaspanin (TM9SF) [Corchorus olitorius]